MSTIAEVFNVGDRYRLMTSRGAAGGASMGRRWIRLRRGGGWDVTREEPR